MSLVSGKTENSARWSIRPSCSCNDSLFTISDTECSEIEADMRHKDRHNWKRSQRRSVHNIGNPVRNSFVDGIKTTSTPKNQVSFFSLRKS
ncbi:hypothetical protein B9Z55_019632 [Caenorhabditis nigoni]|uniref:Uncharacterized protein n=1 Tax=Caenorhabditis nigoni TaxID=1611254 RepID=A0A2G5TJC1_9PELO|nr:hypothetical protein B9Z55_019632 [Caenorhabditis nigoni]